MRWALLLTACAATTHEVSPRHATAEQTACELSGLTIKDYEEDGPTARWKATCYGRVFACASNRQRKRARSQNDRVGAVTGDTTAD
jgi:hypothetical protein